MSQANLSKAFKSAATQRKLQVRSANLGAPKETSEQAVSLLIDAKYDGDRSLFPWIQVKATRKLTQEHAMATANGTKVYIVPPVLGALVYANTQIDQIRRGNAETNNSKWNKDINNIIKTMQDLLSLSSINQININSRDPVLIWNQFQALGGAADITIGHSVKQQLSKFQFHNIWPITKITQVGAYISIQTACINFHMHPNVISDTEKIAILLDLVRSIDEENSFNFTCESIEARPPATFDDAFNAIQKKESELLIRLNSQSLSYADIATGVSSSSYTQINEDHRASIATTSCKYCKDKAGTNHTFQNCPDYWWCSDCGGIHKFLLGGKDGKTRLKQCPRKKSNDGFTTVDHSKKPKHNDFEATVNTCFLAIDERVSKSEKNIAKFLKSSEKQTAQMAVLSDLISKSMSSKSSKKSPTAAKISKKPAANLDEDSD